MQVQTIRDRSAMLQEMVVTIFLLFLKQPPGWHLKHWFVPITFLHLCPSTSCVPSPFFVNSSFPLVTQLCSSSCSCFLFPTSSIPSSHQNPELLCTAPVSSAELIHSTPHLLQWTPTQTSAQADWKPFHRMDSPVKSGCKLKPGLQKSRVIKKQNRPQQLWMCILEYAFQEKKPLTPGISSPSPLSFYITYLILLKHKKTRKLRELARIETKFYLKSATYRKPYSDRMKMQAYK